MTPHLNKTLVFTAGLLALLAAYSFPELSAYARSLPVQNPAAREEGIPVTDSLVKEKCGVCHTSDAKGNMQRISWERATPEAWELALQRMVLLYDVDLTPGEKDHVIQYLSRSHGLAPEEAQGVIYDVERRIHEDTDTPESVTKACGRCHNFARVMSWRRSVDDWQALSQSHMLRYSNSGASDETMAFLAKAAPLHTPEWDAWARRAPGKSAAGRWLVTASVHGRIRYFGEMTMDPAGAEGGFDTRASLRSVVDGSTVVRQGHGILNGGYAWRGVSRSNSATKAAPDDLSNDAQEVMTIAADEASANGRWFWGQYQELGFDVKIQRASSETTLLGIDPPTLKAGSQSNRLRLFGDHFPAQISQTDLELGPGVSVRRIVSHDASEIIAEVNVAQNTASGKRNVAFRRSVIPKAVGIYDHVDYIKITPESAMAAYGEPNRRARGYQLFEAIAFQNGPDGKRHTEDDVELGPIDAGWSLKIFYETEGAQTDAAGLMSPTGLFTPAAESPKTNFDLWVVAQAKTEKDEDGEPLVAKAYLVVTVPFYVFGGRRYVRDLDRWVDDGPAGPAQR